MTDAAGRQTVIARQSIPRLLLAASICALVGIGSLVLLMMTPKDSPLGSFDTALFGGWLVVMSVCGPLGFYALSTAAMGSAAIYAEGGTLLFNITEQCLPIRSYRARPREIVDVRRVKPGPRFPWGGEPIFITILCRNTANLRIITFFFSTPLSEIAANFEALGVRTEGVSPAPTFPQA
jgi:hypothetical protein